MHPSRHAVHAEEHHAEERRLEEERGEHLVGEQRPGDVADGVHVARPVGAELKAHHHAGDHAHGEGEREHLHPQLVRIQPGGISRSLVAHAEVQEHPCKSDGDRRKQDVKADVQAELDAGKEQRFFHAVVRIVALR
jgi:hypothetical protein